MGLNNIEEIESVLEKIWDLHDKLSDTIHSISRTHFINSKNPEFSNKKTHFSDHLGDNNNNGFVFVKDFSAISEAKSLNSIRCALENLEDQLQFFHTVHAQQRADRDAALERLQKSRTILASRLAEHNGKKYKVIDEAINFMRDVQDANCFTAPAQHTLQRTQVSSNLVTRLLLTGFDITKRTLHLDKIGGVLGNAALFALSMIAMLHLHQMTYKGNDIDTPDSGLKRGKSGLKSSRVDGFSYSGSHLDVRLARG